MTSQQEQKETSSDKFTYTSRVPKIIGSAVGATATWQLLSSGSASPVGGLDFFVTFLAPKSAGSIALAGDATVDFASWGPLRKSFTILRPLL
jgi:hypothetical protein